MRWSQLEKVALQTQTFLRLLVKHRHFCPYVLQSKTKQCRFWTSILTICRLWNYQYSFVVALRKAEPKCQWLQTVLVQMQTALILITELVIVGATCTSLLCVAFFWITEWVKVTTVWCQHPWRLFTLRGSRFHIFKHCCPKRCEQETGGGREDQDLHHAVGRNIRQTRRKHVFQGRRVNQTLQITPRLFLAWIWPCQPEYFQHRHFQAFYHQIDISAHLAERTAVLRGWGSHCWSQVITIVPQGEGMGKQEIVAVVSKAGANLREVFFFFYLEWWTPEIHSLDHQGRCFQPRGLKTTHCCCCGGWVVESGSSVASGIASHFSAAQIIFPSAVLAGVWKETCKQSKR